MKLEMRKVKFGSYVRATLIANLIMIGLIFLLNFAEKSEGNIPFKNFNDIFYIISSMTKHTFTIFASVIIARIIIDEYKNKTIAVLFMYPINRKKLIISKLLIVSIFTFLAIVFSNIFISSIVGILNPIIKFTTVGITKDMLVKNAIGLCLNSISTTCLSLMPLYFGMRKKSVPATIVSAILIVTFIGSNFDGFSFGTILIVPIVLGFLGLFAAYLSIKNIENEDAL